MGIVCDRDIQCARCDTIVKMAGCSTNINHPWQDTVRGRRARKSAHENGRVTMTTALRVILRFSVYDGCVLSPARDAWSQFAIYLRLEDVPKNVKNLQRELVFSLGDLSTSHDFCRWGSELYLGLQCMVHGHSSLLSRGDDYLPPFSEGSCGRLHRDSSEGFLNTK